MTWATSSADVRIEYGPSGLSLSPWLRMSTDNVRYPALAKYSALGREVAPVTGSSRESFIFSCKAICADQRVRGHCQTRVYLKTRKCWDHELESGAVNGSPLPLA